MAFSATSTTGWTIPQTQIRVPSPARRLDTPATRFDFAACIDRCVRALITAAPTQIGDTTLRRLQIWLSDDMATLADGTPINFALFDEILLRIDERISQTGASNQPQLLRASRQLAESVYAKT